MEFLAGAPFHDDRLRPPVEPHQNAAKADMKELDGCPTNDGANYPLLPCFPTQGTNGTALAPTVETLDGGSCGRLCRWHYSGKPDNTTA